MTTEPNPHHPSSPLSHALLPHSLTPFPLPPTSPFSVAIIKLEIISKHNKKWCLNNVDIFLQSAITKYCVKIVFKHNRKIAFTVLNNVYIFGDQQSTLLTKHGQSAVTFTNKLFCRCHNVNIISHLLVHVKNSKMVQPHLSH